MDLVQVYAVNGTANNMNLGSKVYVHSSTGIESGYESHNIYYQNKKQVSNFVNEFYVGMLSIMHYDKVSQLNKLERSVSYFNNPTQYKQVVRSKLELDGKPPSKFSDFSFYHDKDHDHLFMKQEIDTVVEMAAQCGHTQRFESGEYNTCKDCDAGMFTLRAQDTQCLRCIDIYEDRNRSDSIQAVLYSQFCREFRHPSLITPGEVVIVSPVVVAPELNTTESKVVDVVIPVETVKPKNPPLDRPAAI